MRRLFFAFLSTAAVCALVSAAPTSAATAPGAAASSASTAGAASAAANGTDARFQAMQAESHPMMVDQYPNQVPPGVLGSEDYPSRRTYGRGYGYDSRYGAAGAATAMIAAPLGAAEVVLAAPFGAETNIAPAFNVAQAYVAAPFPAARTHPRCHVIRGSYSYGFTARYTSVCRF